MERPEPYEGKLSRTVLRGVWAGNRLHLPDQAQVDLPPAESLQPTLALPLISHRLFLEARGPLTVPAPALPASPDPALSLSG